VSGYDLVEGVDERGGAERSERPLQRPRQPDLGEERHAATRVAGDGRPVAKDQPPAFVARFLGHVSEEAAGCFVGQRQQSELFSPVEPGDDTRRPPAELSGAGIEQDRTR
jgi:hypothetical protein